MPVAPAVFGELGACGGVDWIRAVVDSISVRAEDDLTGPNPVGRGKPGNKIHTRGRPHRVLLTALTSAASIGPVG